MPEKDHSKAATALLTGLEYLQEQSPDIARDIVNELEDQRRSLKMIASENYCSYAVQLAMGNWLTDKYAEGYVHHRFYAGCEHVDAIEDSACHHLKALFGADHVYVQPHSGSDANLIAYWAILCDRVQSKELEKLQKKSVFALTSEEFETVRKELLNQKLLGMSLNSGGHLTHGFRFNISSKIFKTHFYDVDRETGRLDYDQIRKQAQEVQPAILLAGYSAYPRAINFARMREIADEVGATLFVDMAHFSGLVAGKVFQGEFNPVPYADIITSTTHKTLRGPRGGLILCKEYLKDYVDKGCPLVQGGPLPHVIAAKAVAFQEAREPSFQIYAQKVVENAKKLAESLQKYNIKVLTGGTDNHMLIIDLSNLNITGKHAEAALRDCYITVNRNAIPFDPNGTWFTSGVRIGTPALTTRGMGPDEMDRIAGYIATCLQNIVPKKDDNGEMNKSAYQLDESVKLRLQREVEELLAGFPLYPEINVKGEV